MKASQKAEILAPAGNFRMLTAAVRCGADAVYLGAEEFSARRNAENFSPDELKKAVEYCHTAGVKVYLALNILIKQNELEKAFLLARSAYNMSIDAVIIEDIGIARLLHGKLPQLKLHASTQMSVLSPAALPVLKELGFSRVVVGREMSKSELAAFCKEAEKYGTEVEAFVHGALCMSVSGQCRLSAFLGSRSGNRGLCAGPCRLPFKVKNGTGYDLSLKDLSLLSYVGELYDMGVRSFKIEGRMKRPEYVAAAVTACRQALDNRQVEPELADTLKNVFSRSGFTAGYYEGTPGKEMFGIRTREDVLSADKELPELHALYRFERKSVGVELRARINDGEPVTLILCDGENTVTVGGNPPQRAQNRPLCAADAEKSLTKFGDTPFYVKSADIEVSPGLFVSAGELNALRRAACEKLTRERTRVKTPKSDAEYTPPQTAKPEKREYKTIIRLESLSQLPENLEDVAAVILPLEKIDRKITEIPPPVIADIPDLLNEAAAAAYLENFARFGGKAALCANLAQITLVKRAGLTPIGGAGLNICNNEALVTLKSFGIDAAIISYEEKIADISRLCTEVKKGILAYGNLPLMLTRCCPLKNGVSCKDCDKNGVITDRRGVSFPIRCRGDGRELLNSMPVWLADKKDDFSSLDFIVLYFTRETPERVNEVIKAYKSGAPCDAPFSRGLYYRGTL